MYCSSPDPSAEFGEFKSPNLVISSTSVVSINATSVRRSRFTIHIRQRRSSSDQNPILLTEWSQGLATKLIASIILQSRAHTSATNQVLPKQTHAHTHTHKHTPLMCCRLKPRWAMMLFENQPSSYFLFLFQFQNTAHFQKSNPHFKCRILDFSHYRSCRSISNSTKSVHTCLLETLHESSDDNS